MPGSKRGLTCPRTKGHENDGTVNWCKHVCRFPSPLTTNPDYKAWRDAVFHRMQQDRIRGWALVTPEQWAAIQAYGLSLEPLASNGRAALWQEDTRSGQHFTECYDYLLKDIAKSIRERWPAWVLLFLRLSQLLLPWPQIIVSSVR